MPSGPQLRRARWKQLNATPGCCNPHAGRAAATGRCTFLREAAVAGRTGFPDTGEARETCGEMGDRLASMGYVALIRTSTACPSGPLSTCPPCGRTRKDPAGQPHERSHQRPDHCRYVRLRQLLLARQEVTGSGIDTIGYRLGGRMPLIAAGGRPHARRGGVVQRRQAGPGRRPVESSCVSRLHYQGPGKVGHAV